jgi:hypothetical protein
MARRIVFPVPPGRPLSGKEKREADRIPHENRWPTQDLSFFLSLVYFAKEASQGRTSDDRITMLAVCNDIDVGLPAAMQRRLLARFFRKPPVVFRMDNLGMDPLG